jgi:hypothetical protein
MLPEHRQNCMKSYWMSRAALERSSSARPISFMDLERWAAQSDAELINAKHHRGSVNNWKLMRLSLRRRVTVRAAAEEEVRVAEFMV